MNGMRSAPFRCLVVLSLMVDVCPAGASAATDVEQAVAPVYPGAAAASGIGGTIAVEVRLSEAGAVVNATVGEGPAQLRQASLEAARLWRFPAQPAGRGIKLTFLFRLMPKDTPAAQLGAVFRPPYTVEVRRIEAEKVTHYARSGSRTVPGVPPGGDRPRR